MSFVNANLPVQMFWSQDGYADRNWNAIDYFQAVSNANNTISLNPTQFAPIPGRLRKLILNYFPLQCDVLGSCDGNVCDGGVDVQPEQAELTIGRCVASKEYSVSKDSTRLTDNRGWDFTGVARAIRNMIMPQLRKELAIDMITRASQLAGLHPDGWATHRITVTDPTNGVVNVIGYNEVIREYTDAGLGEPYLLGGAEVDNWLSMRAIGGLNAQGQYVNRMPSLNAWYDQGLIEVVKNDAANGGWILAIDPQVFKYVWYLENAGEYGTTAVPASVDSLNLLFRQGTETLLNGVLVDPVNGVPWDFDLYYSPCGKKWTFKLKHQYEFFVIPSTCLPQGSNGIWYYRTCAPKIAPCPTGDTPSPAQPLVTFSATPGSIYPRTIYGSVIAGQTVTQQTPQIVTNIAELAAFLSDNSNISFEVNGSDIEYDGHTAITASLITNNGTVELNFTS